MKHPKILTRIYLQFLPLKDVNGIANSIDPDQTAPVAICSGSVPFAYLCVSGNIRSLWYMYVYDEVINLL